MKSITELSPQDKKKIKGVCFDIDDTFSSHGKIEAIAFSALWELKKAGYFLIPITGRPAGWCDHIARFWPVDAVVGENGAFTFYMEKGIRKRLDTPFNLSPTQSKEQLTVFKKELFKKFPQARVASDQDYREFDCAIDICEDVPPWPEKDVSALLDFCAAAGAHAKLSSIHVNIWFGDYDKKMGFKACEKMLSEKIENFPKLQEWMFMGDSPNDEPLFQFFDYSVGVANLKKYLDKIKNPPKFCTTSESGQGFAEAAQVLLK